ncbi:hypothetical protein [Paenibacillus sp. MMS18-CY102]|uniref:hypothetical protein n=1 Tax=Paenibacillus sp. MMS18-CY102 TaxID=2682849 RepID=UPI0013666060|nr:hypothetical protein [Paenibacillus sp. MMS18-CY102]MWC27843.1 hypothetical protein [Paenibacillus sp. MMS18-CY102]
MNWFTDYKAALSVIATQVSERIQAFPEPLATAGGAYWRAYNPLEQGSTKNYVCYLLPLWTNESCKLPEDQVERLTAGCIFAMLYFFLLDDQADGQLDGKLASNPAPEDSESSSSCSAIPAYAVALTALFHAEMMQLFQAEFPAASPFWALYRRYLNEWAIAIATEQQRSLPKPSDPIEAGDSFNFTHKSAPVKLASACIALAAGQASWIPKLDASINSILLTLQMADDWKDWEEDWDHGSNSNLLIIHLNNRYHASLPEGEPRIPLTREQLEDELYLKSGLRSFAAIASKHHQLLLDDCNMENQLEHTMSHLHTFHGTITKQLNNAAELIENKKSQFIHGGLFNILSN